MRYWMLEYRTLSNIESFRTLGIFDRSNLLELVNDRGWDLPGAGNVQIWPVPGIGRSGIWPGP